MANLLASKGGKVWKEAEGRLRELQESHLAGCAPPGLRWVSRGQGSTDARDDTAAAL